MDVPTGRINRATPAWLKVLSASTLPQLETMLSRAFEERAKAIREDVLTRVASGEQSTLT